MNQRPAARRLFALAFALALATATRTQVDMATLATAMVAAQAPAVDDPDAVARDLLAAAMTQPRSPVAALLVAEAGRWLGQLQDPAALLTTLEAPLPEHAHGHLVQECAVLRWRLGAALGRGAGERYPVFGHAESLLACGPFGDAGDAFVGVGFAPELAFPNAGLALDGRGGEAMCLLRTRTGNGRRIDLLLPPHHRPGCHYGRWRISAAAEVDGFCELEHDGDCQTFVDGIEVFRLERWRRTARSRHHIGLRLPAGGHEVVVKTASNGRSTLALRFVDAEGHALPGVSPADEAAFALGAPAAKTGAAFVTGEDVLARLAAEPNAAPAVRIAAILVALRDGDGDRALDLAADLREHPPQAAPLALAFARVLRSLPLPDELRKAEARALEEQALTTLLPAHHTARLTKVGHAEEQDQREAALALLAAHPAAGPETFARRVELLRQLRFTAELLPTLWAWTKACPRDSRPWAQLATELPAPVAAQALARRERSLQLRPDQPTLAGAACRDAIALRRFDAAARWLDLAFPLRGDRATLPRLRLELELAQARGDDASSQRIRREMREHPQADASSLLQLAAAYYRDGDDRGCNECLAAAQRLDDGPALRTWQTLAGGPPAPIDELQPLRRDGAAAVRDFRAGEREQGASMTVLIDQRMLVMAADGSWTEEGHEVRRINDQAGVERFAEKVGLASADEVLLVRTLSADGSESVPARIEEDYALPRLQPGAFVEWRYRRHGRAPAAGVVSTNEFLFGSVDEPIALGEFVVVLPTGRGELRTRNLGAPTATRKLADGRAVHVWTRTGIPTLAKEQFLPSLLDLLPCAGVGEDAPPWPTYRDHRVQLGSRCRPTAPIRAAAERLVATAIDERGKAAAIWTFVQTEIEDGNADSALDTLLRKKGNRFLLAVALLRAAGLTVEPMACAEEAPELGPGPMSLFRDSSPLQFPAALLSFADGASLPLFLDAPRHWELGRVPAQRAGSIAAVWRGDEVNPLVLPASLQANQHVEVQGKATLRDRELVLVATATIGDVAGFALAERLRQLPENTRKLAARQIAQQLCPGFRIEAAGFTRSQDGQPVTLEITVKKSGLQRSGDRVLVPLPLPPTKFATTFGDRADRTLPWRLPIDLATTWTVDFDAGDELRIVQVPSSVDLVCEPLRFEQHTRPSSRQLRLRRYTRLVPATRPAAAFDDWLRTLAAADRAEQATIELVAK